MQLCCDDSAHIGATLSCMKNHRVCVESNSSEAGPATLDNQKTAVIPPSIDLGLQSEDPRVYSQRKESRRPNQMLQPPQLTPPLFSEGVYDALRPNVSVFQRINDTCPLICHISLGTFKWVYGISQTFLVGIWHIPLYHIDYTTGNSASTLTSLWMMEPFTFSLRLSHPMEEIISATCIRDLIGLVTIHTS